MDKVLKVLEKVARGIFIVILSPLILLVLLVVFTAGGRDMFLFTLKAIWEG